MVITKVERWVTSDGREHSSHCLAMDWEARVAGAAKATEMLKAGSSVADCLWVMYETYEVDPILERITKDTELVIPFLHCHAHCYKVDRFKADGDVWVLSAAGSGRGLARSELTIADLVRHAKLQIPQLQLTGTTT